MKTTATRMLLLLLTWVLIAAAVHAQLTLTNATLDLQTSPPTVVFVDLDDEFGVIPGQVFQPVLGVPTPLAVVSWEPGRVEAELATTAPSDYVMFVKPSSSPAAFFTLTIPDSNAATLGGLEADQLLRSDASDSFAGRTLTIEVGSSLKVEGSLDTSGATSLSLPASGIGGAGDGSGLDADTLDGLDSEAFLATGTDLWLDQTGDTLTGDLDLVDANLLKDGALFLHDNGFINTALGHFALVLNTTGDSNTAMGDDAMRNNTTGRSNTAVGESAMRANSIGNSNTAVGEDALTSNTIGDSNTVVGADAMRMSTTGSANTVLGASALLFNSDGDSNTAVGVSAMFNNDTGSSNTAVGERAMLANTGGGSNVALGREALLNATTGGSNIAIGFGAGRSVATGSFNIHIGNDGLDEERTTRIGRLGGSTRAFIAGIRGVRTDFANAVPVVVDSLGQLGTVSSSRRYKEDISHMGGASSGLLRLRPVTFRYKKPFADDQKPTQFGLIAEQVAEVFPELVVFNEEGRPETVKYQQLSSLLLNELQKQHRELETVRAQLEEQAGRQSEFAARLTLLESTSDRPLLVTERGKCERSRHPRQPTHAMSLHSETLAVGGIHDRPAS